MEKRKRLKSIVSVIIEGDNKGNKKVVEKFKISPKGKKELTFMSKEREQNLKKQKQFSKYIKQFDKIPRGLK